MKTLIAAILLTLTIAPGLQAAEGYVTGARVKKVGWYEYQLKDTDIVYVSNNWCTVNFQFLYKDRDGYAKVNVYTDTHNPESATKIKFFSAIRGEPPKTCDVVGIERM